MVTVSVEIYPGIQRATVEWSSQLLLYTTQGWAKLLWFCLLQLAAASCIFYFILFGRLFPLLSSSLFPWKTRLCLLSELSRYWTLASIVIAISFAQTLSMPERSLSISVFCLVGKSFDDDFHNETGDQRRLWSWRIQAGTGITLLRALLSHVHTKDEHVHWRYDGWCWWQWSNLAKRLAWPPAEAEHSDPAGTGSSHQGCATCVHGWLLARSLGVGCSFFSIKSCMNEQQQIVNYCVSEMWATLKLFRAVWGGGIPVKSHPCGGH